MRPQLQSSPTDRRVSADQRLPQGRGSSANLKCRDVEKAWHRSPAAQRVRPEVYRGGPCSLDSELLPPFAHNIFLKTSGESPGLWLTRLWGSFFPRWGASRKQCPFPDKLSIPSLGQTEGSLGKRISETWIIFSLPAKLFSHIPLLLWALLWGKLPRGDAKKKEKKKKSLN